MKNKNFYAISTAVICGLFLAGCSTNSSNMRETVKTSQSTMSIDGCEIKETSHSANWDDLSDVDKKIQRSTAEGKGHVALLWNDHVEWLGNSVNRFPQEQKQWLEEQVANYAHSDAPVSCFSGLGSDDFKIMRAHIDGGKAVTVSTVNYRDHHTK